MLDKLRGGNLRSIGRSNEIVAAIKENPMLIEEVFPGLHDRDPVLKARAADVTEKATRKKPELLIHHKSKIVRVSALEAITDLAQRNISFVKEVTKTIRFHIETGSPALQARGRKLLKRFKSQSINDICN